MDTIKIKVHEITETEKEVKLPAYYRNICFLWKIYTPTKAVRVYEGHDPYERGIEVTRAQSIFENSTTEAVECTQLEFETAFLNAVKTLSSFAENGIVIEKQIETI